MKPAIVSGSWLLWRGLRGCRPAGEQTGETEPLTWQGVYNAGGPGSKGKDITPGDER